MNKERRAEIARIVKLITDAQALMEEARDAVGSVKDEESEYYDNMPESLQSGDKGSKAQEAVDSLETAFDALENIDFDEITGALETAAE